MIQFECPGCRSRLGYSDDEAGTRQTCPNCGQSVSVPGGSAEPSQIPLTAPPTAIPSIPAEGRKPRKSSGLATASLVLGLCSFIPLLVGILLPSLNRAQELARRSICKARLKGFGRALAIYSVNNDDQYPYNAGRGTTVRNPTALNNLALLVLEGQQPGKMFVCPSKKDDHSELIVERDSQGATQIVDEYGKPNGSNRISYSYQAAMYDGTNYLGNGVSMHTLSGLAIMADRTPGKDSEVADWNYSENARNGISQNHRGEVVNVLYEDTHVGDARRGDVGVYDDNIYTVSAEEDGDSRGTFRADGSGHEWVNDSVLISDDGN